MPFNLTSIVHLTIKLLEISENMESRLINNGILMNPLRWLKNLWIVPTDPRLIKMGEDWAKQHFPQSSQAVASKVISTIAEMLGVSITQLIPTARFVEDLKVDDVCNAAELIMAIEENFGVSIPDQDAERILTVADLVHYIEKRTYQVVTTNSRLGANS